MGNFYTNYTLRGASQQSVAAILAGRSTVITPAQDDCVVVFDEESDKQNSEVIAELASQMSGALGCPLLAVLNHDDDIFWYQLYLSGELVDEYNSTPNYFEEAEDEAPPLGGDAQKLCDAFGVKTVAKAKKILRATFDDYTFAFERHADLADALGIPAFGVGACFDRISGGELPEGLHERDLVKTKDLLTSRVLIDFRKAVTPGYYKLSFRANPKLTESKPVGWFPPTWADLECSEQQLSQDFHRATAQIREKLRELRFTEQGFRKAKRLLDPNRRDNGGICYLDESRHYFGLVIYGRTFLPAIQIEKDHVSISFTAAFQNEVLICTNNTVDILGTAPNHQIVRIKTDDVGALYQTFLERLQQRTEQPRHFPDSQSLQVWSDANALEILEDKVRRGIFVRMSNYEVDVARRKLSAPHE